MKELEKILEEIEQAKREPWYRLNNYDVKHKLDGAINLIVDIIRKHMNDGWIPVEERLPEDDGYYLVQLSQKIPSEDYSDRVVVLYSGEDKDFMCYSSLIVAWKFLPDPYRPRKEQK